MFCVVMSIVTASTDELSQLGSCFLQLKLVIDRGDKKESVLMGIPPSLSPPPHPYYLYRCKHASI
jgi:hypothetical protein